MKSKLSRPERLLFACSLLLASLAPATTQAAGFAATVSPPRFELRAAPGDTLNEIVEINNADKLPVDFKLRTADWDLTDNGNVTIHGEELQPNSCRPWARIERHRIRIAPERARRYRFQIRVPEDAPAGECRLALLIEGNGEDKVMAGNDMVKFPVQGRIAVVIYVAVGDASPQLNLLEVSMDSVNQQQIPVAVFRNDGNAHGRPSGILDGTDAIGVKQEFSVSPSPIMPGQTRRIPIWPAVSDAVEIVSPLQLKGTIEWEGGKHEIDEAVSPTHQIGLKETGQ